MRAKLPFKKNNSRAFSLVELSVVITIISLVLVAILSNTVSG
ncbi:MAG: type II secretion system protein, partial [Rickettsiales bacterium]|nr:type II secretion system protein [Rickettsiales bacterium]